MIRWAHRLRDRVYAVTCALFAWYPAVPAPLRRSVGLGVFLMCARQLDLLENLTQVLHGPPPLPCP